MNGVTASNRRATTHGPLVDGTEGAPIRCMLRILGFPRALWLLVLLLGLNLEARANGLRVRDEGTKVTITAEKPPSTVSLYVEFASAGSKPWTKDISSDPNAKGNVVWSGNTIVIKRVLEPATGQFVFPLRADDYSDLRKMIDELGSSFVFGCSIQTPSGTKLTCPLLNYEPPRFSVYNHYIQASTKTILPLVSGASVWRVYRKKDSKDKSGKTWVAAMDPPGSSTPAGPQPTINAKVKSGNYPAVIVVKGQSQNSVTDRIKEYTGQEKPKLPASVSMPDKTTYYGTRSLVNRWTSVNLTIPPEFQYSGFTYAIKQTFGAATNNQWAYVKGMALYDGVTVVPITDYKKFDYNTSFVKNSLGNYPDIYTKWGLKFFEKETLAFEASIPDRLIEKSGKVASYTFANAYTE